jgi:CheY-like chemotaxis protein
LIVDDDPQILSLVTGVLESAGYETQTAENGKEAVELARLLKPTVVLCDASMPEMPGVDVVQTLKSETATAHIPIVLMSAFHESTFENAGADAFVGKPFSFDELIAIVGSVIHREDSLA